MVENEDSRAQGIEFGDLPGALESIEYPADVEAVREALGDHEIHLATGSTTLGEVLAPLDDETFESAEGVLDTVRNLVGDEAVGREEYTDRGAGGTEQDQERDRGRDQSF